MADLILGGSLAACDRAADYSWDCSRFSVSRAALHASARLSISDLGTEITRLTKLRNRSNAFSSGGSVSSMTHGLGPTIMRSLLSGKYGTCAGSTSMPAALNAVMRAPYGVVSSIGGGISLLPPTNTPDRDGKLVAPARTTAGEVRKYLFRNLSLPLACLS